MKNDFSYLPITTDIMLMAAELWAEARNKGYQSASNDSLDGDVILAAQTIQLINAGYKVVIVTHNIKHLIKYTNAELWNKL